MHEDPADWMGRLMASPDTSTHPFAQAYTNEYNAIRGMSILEVLQQTLLEVGQREHQVLLGVRRQAAAIRKNRIVVLSKDVQATAQENIPNRHTLHRAEDAQQQKKGSILSPCSEQKKQDMRLAYALRTKKEEEKRKEKRARALDKDTGLLGSVRCPRTGSIYQCFSETQRQNMRTSRTEWARFCGESRRTCLGPNAPTGLSHRVIQRKPDLDREKEIRQEQMTWNRKSSCCIRYQPGAAHTAGLPTQIHEKTKRQATKASINMLAEQKAEHERARASERETHRARCNSDMEEQSGGNTEESDYANERDSDHERVSDGEGDANSDNEGQCGRNYEESDNENEDEREQEPEQEQELA